MVTIGLVQADIRPGAVAENLSHYEAMLQQQLTSPVQLLVFPEMFACGFGPDLGAYADADGGQAVAFMQRMARQYACEVVGTVLVREQSSLYNRLYWMTADGPRATYDKHHLFFGEEREQCTPGTRRTIVEAFGYRFLPLICFDVRFPEWSRNHRVNRVCDYDCLLYTANFPAPREEVLLRLAAARAIENQAYVAVVNRIGTDGNGFAHRGGTAVFDPEGKMLASAAFDKEEILITTMPLHCLAGLRKRFPVLSDRQ
jgi:predicted amidohydrolase